jgi:hypothetical protein
MNRQAFGHCQNSKLTNEHDEKLETKYSKKMTAELKINDSHLYL